MVYYIIEENMNIINKLMKRIKIEDNFIKIPYWKETKNEKINDFYYRRIETKINKKIKKLNIDNVVMQQRIKNIYNLQVNKLNGDIIFKNSIQKTLKFILKKLDNKPEDMDVYVCINEKKQYIYNQLIDLGNIFRTINLVTNNIKEIKEFEKVLENDLITTTISNNKRKALRRAELIINVDFEENELNEYLLNRNAIIINLPKIKINQKSFQGINIIGIKILLNESAKYRIREDIKYLCNFEEIELYESEIIDEKEKWIKIGQDVNILNLIGQKGAIREEEYTRIKNMCKSKKSIAKEEKISI